MDTNKKYNYITKGGVPSLWVIILAVCTVMTTVYGLSTDPHGLGLLGLALLAVVLLTTAGFNLYKILRCLKRKTE